MYIVWANIDDGWQRNNVETFEEAERLREQLLSRGEGDVVLTEVVDHAGIGGLDQEIKSLALMKREMDRLDGDAAKRVADWALSFARRR